MSAALIPFYNSHCTGITSSGVVLKQQFLSSSLNVPQHIKAMSQTGSKRHIVGQRHGELEVSERQRGDKP